ncbi:MAG: hypothetical protein JW801_11910 [Bacteroidales bacterium]|nr:hypothetical protein [Bacteroidales bacterium]
MFEVIFLKGSKILLKNRFNNRQEAEDFINLEPHEYSCAYQIYDVENDEVVDEGDIESDDDIEEGTRNMMYPDEDY